MPPPELHSPRPPGVTSPDLRSCLDRLHATFDAAWLSPDPLEFVRRWESDADREIAGFYAAGIAYGRVDQILKSLERLGKVLGPHPADFVRRFSWKRDAPLFRGVYHRFHSARDFALLTEILHRALDERGSLERWFVDGDDGSRDVGPALSAFTGRFRALGNLPAGAGVTRGRLSPDSPVNYFFSSPEKGSACKRLNLWLRWMVRGGDGLDLGAWSGVDRSRLVIPLDTHVARISRAIGLSSRRTADWAMAVEVTDSLRALDPADPVKYDFAICRLGILDHCPRRRDPVRCAGCLLQPICTL